ncbi:MAG: dihydroneopterin aldolase [Rikenellaceae bacterium]
MREVIEIEKMEVYAYHGCYEAEKIVGNRFEIYLRVECDASRSALTDKVTDTVSYLDLFATVKREMLIGSNILENVAYRVLTAIKNEFPAVEKVRIKISKLNPPLGGDIERVSVTMDL